MLIGDVPHITFANTGSGRRIISVIIQACEMMNTDEIFSIHLYICIFIPIYKIWNVAECYIFSGYGSSDTNIIPSLSACK